MFDFKQARKNTGLSIRKAAYAMQVDVKTLCDIESGRKKPSAKMVYRLAKQYNLPVEETLAVTRGTKHDTLRWYRERNGLTRREVAEKLHVEIRTLYDWESGRHTPQVDLSPLCQLYGISMDEIKEAISNTKKEHNNKCSGNE